MNILLDTLPETVEVEGRDFFIDTDFRTFIIMEKIMLDRSMGSREQFDNIIGLFYTDEVPQNMVKAMHAVLDIYRCGLDNKGRTSVRKNGNVELRPRMIYDYVIDAPYIYGAFLAQYGIDLNEIDYLHWWKFQALFRSLNSCHKIVEIMSYRAADLSKIENTKERNRIASLQRQYALPDNLSHEDKVAMAGAAFGGGLF